jgi:hypothetical protein
MTKRKRSSVWVRLRPQERNWLETIKEVHEVPFAAAIRVGIRLAAEKLGVVAPVNND